ncbi:ABC transporter permease [Paradevosia shaoguanensis]|jgi:peptide/nickel transport system permease protein|uniref:ABC transporter permease n=1 Tax=Paradevosia shaoguanensis TaxID=1335043 RepID=A0AA41QMR0_9HYPH|nr:ABC transporter permease [Paradevosia shaoguanensis]KFL25915.1 ABC transporter permease [Devosia sp. 17-2-E-8]MBI4046792.1 ABC transporter permease [Devosia nanyangense]QMV02090.1 ABC transporter permease subunit [Devosia sp. D6-9]CDP54085.1 Dipeptide transport system permease protein DppB [Devosia sp. DBB001]MCF1742539.1 ABC transporter permease [Paradevosia shaoguanensis]
MIRFALGKLAEAAIAVWGVVTIVFFVSRVLGDPAVLLLPLGASETELNALRSSLGLDQPILVQYFNSMGAVLRGDFGMSFQHMRPALDVVLERMPATAILAFAALVLGVLIGAVAGTIAALNRGKLAELIVMTAALLGQATPVFWLGLMMILFFSVQLGWLPSAGSGTWAHLVLPAVTLAVFVSASIARLLRSSLLEILGEDYVRTARAKGLLPQTIFTWHVARNALIPVVTMIGIIAGELLGGSVVTETVFGWPGVGRLIVQAIQNQDFPVIQAGVAVVAIIFVFINLAIDLLYGVLDPRIRRER